MRELRLTLLVAGLSAATLLSGCSLLKDFDFEEQGECTGGLEECDGLCVDVDTDRLACGACGTICPGETSLCDMGVCQEMRAVESSHHYYTATNATTPISVIASAADRGFYYGVNHSSELSLQEAPAQVRVPAGNSEANFGKYAANGNLNWANGIIGPLGEYVHGVSATPDGAVAVGYFSSTTGASFTDSMGVVENHSANTASGMGYVWAVNADGTTKWWQDIRGSTYARNAHVASDADGNIYVGGYFSGTLQVAGSPDISGALSLGYFVACLRPNGARNWEAVMDISTSAIVDSMAVSSDGTVYLFGSSSGVVTVAGTALPAGAPAIFAVDSTGLLWWEHYDSAAPATGGLPSIALTSDDRIFVAFDVNNPSSAIGDILLDAGGTLVELDATDGTPIGVVSRGADDAAPMDQPILNELAVTPYSLGVDDTDTLIVVGDVTGDDVDLGGGLITKPGSDNDALIVGYTPYGEYRYARIYGTTLSDRATRSAVHPTGRVTTAGNFNEGVTWDSVTLMPAGGTGQDTYFVAHEPGALTP